MAALEKTIKLTQAQYNTLAAGGTVGSYTGLNANYLYLVQDDASYALTSAANTFTGEQTLPKLYMNTQMSSSNTNGGIYGKLGSNKYLMMGFGSSNLWIGANETAGTHHSGSTYISTGQGERLKASALINGQRVNKDIAYVSDLLDKVYPIGSIYMSANNVSPQTFLGGTWTAVSAGRFLLGAGSGYSAGATGGESTHTLTESEMPAHIHGLDPDMANGASSPSNYRTFNSSAIVQQWYKDNGAQSMVGFGLTTSTGGGAAHNNMPPYLVVYMWQRTA